MTTLHILASGSLGNSLLISHKETRLLVDAGISCRRIVNSLRELELSLEDLDAILISHTHSDHIAGLRTLFKRTAVPVYATGPAIRELDGQLEGSGRLRELTLCQPVEIGTCLAIAVPTSHDAPGSCGFRVDTKDGGVGILTDTGYVTREAAELLTGVKLAVLEANHDVEALRSGPYPDYLKERILGECGHLCNADAARFAVALARAGASEIVLAHLSRENNTPAMARGTVEAALAAAGLDPALSVAPRDALSRTYIVAERAALCKK